ncbi:DUF86 domain-containing protein [Candidatus Azambacteria bacterium]|nr:DUF86 domain-containing protein [Candidatus Azambacteria bacterium]
MIKRIPLKSQSIIPRLDGITKDIKKLREINALSIVEFSDEQKGYFDIAKLRLRESLEGIFHIGAHILSRIEGGRTTEYKEIAKKLGEFGIIEKGFANNVLIRMAGYRNRLTHFYAEITSEEIRQILSEHLDDFEIFLSAIKQVLESPQKFDLTIE